MKINQFSVGCSRTINLGNFESLRVEAQVVIDMEDQNLEEENRQQAQNVLRQLLEDTYKAQHKSKGS